MFEKGERLMEHLTARTNRKINIEERQPTVLFMLMSAIDVYFEDHRSDTADKYDALATSLSLPVSGGPSYAEIYKLSETGRYSVSSGEVSNGVNDGKRGESKYFIRAVINCIWESPADFPFLTCKLEITLRASWR